LISFATNDMVKNKKACKSMILYKPFDEFCVN
jgi:hypothetical protein